MRTLLMLENFYDTCIWSRVKTLGSNALTRTSYLWMLIVPVFAKMLSLIDENVVLRIFDTDIIVVAKLPFSWAAFYFSGLSFSIATFLYAWKCPQLIKRFNSFQDFINEHNACSALVRYINEVTQELTHSSFFNNYFAFCAKYRIDKGNNYPCGYIGYKGDPKQTKLAINDRDLPTAFFESSRLLDRERLAYRIFAIFFYAIGYFFLLIVFAQNLFFVLRSVF